MSSINVSKKEAIRSASVLADKCELPQTVYFNGWEWSHTWTGANALRKAKRVFVTVLPIRYFQQ